MWLVFVLVLLGKNSEVAWKVARFGRFMEPVSQFPISVIAMFVFVFEELGGCSGGCSFAREELELAWKVAHFGRYMEPIS